MDDSVSLRVDQVADLAYYIANPKCMNLSEPGTGKTPSVVVYQWFLWSKLGTGTAWVMPKSLLHKNKREILRFTDFKDEDICILEGTPVQILKKLASNAKVYLVTFRRWTISWRNLPDFVTAMMVDEFHKGFKSPDSQACQAMFSAFKWNRFQYFVPMTGTMVSGRLDSAYSAIHVVNPEYYLSYKSFLYSHALYDFDDKIIGWKNHAKLAAIFGRHGIRRLFKDIHGEQEVVYHTEVCEMTAKQRKMYDEFKENALLELEKFFIGGTEPGVNFIRARQLMEHPNFFPDLTKGTDFVDIMPGELPGKLEHLDVHLDDHENTGKPLIIFSALVPQQNQVKKMFDSRGVTYGFINGQVCYINGVKATRDDVDVAFQAGKIQFLIVSPVCADVGFNWQFWGEVEVDHIVFLTTDYLDTTILQAIQRAIRGNRSTPLWVSFMEYEDSLDQHILGIAYRKSVDANKVDPTRKILQLSRYEKDYKKEET